MRIVYLHQYFNTPKMSGGTRSYEMAKRLVAAGHQVDLITTYRNADQTTSGWRTEQIDGINVHWYSQPYANEFGFLQRIRAFFGFAFAAIGRVRQLNADLVFATSTPLTIAFPGIYASRHMSIPLVFEVRDLWPELPIAVGALRNPLLKWAAYSLEWIAYHASAHVVALSPGMAAGIIRRGIPPSKVTVIPNSCDVDIFDVPAEMGNLARERLGLPKKCPLIIYTGTFGFINGVGYLVELADAMRSVAPDARFVLIGRGAEFDKVTDQARKAGLLNKTLWIWPSIPKDELAALLSAATVATSLFIPIEAMWHNSANKFFDALAGGKPIAINYGGWQASLLTENQAGIVLQPDNPAEAAKVLAEFIHDTQRLEKAAAAARNLAYNVFNRDLLYSKLEHVLQQVFHESNAR